MKKLTIKALQEMLKSNYMISNFVGVLKDKNTFYVVYRERVVVYRYNKSCGWCFCLSGTSMYSDTKALVNIVSKLDENYIGDTDND